MGELYYKGSSDSKWQHTHLDSWSHGAPAMSPILLHIRALHETWDEHKGERDIMLGCFWVEPQTLPWVMHRFTVTAWPSLASVVTFFGAGHALKGNRA